MFLERAQGDDGILGVVVRDDALDELGERYPHVRGSALEIVERLARASGYAEVIDGWEPDVPWLRGEADYRSAPPPESTGRRSPG